MSAPINLPEGILEHIFSFSGTYNVVNRAVCKDFRRIAPEVHPLVHLNYLLSQGKIAPDISDEDLLQNMRMIGQAISMQLLHVLDAYEEWLPSHLCRKAVQEDLVEVLYWTRSGDCDRKKKRFPWYGDVASKNPKIVQWIRKEKTVCIILQAPFMSNFD